MAFRLSRYVSWSTHQRQRRAIVKTVCYRVLMVLITVIAAFLITGNGVQAVSIGFVTNFTKTFTYYFYERLWARISWGIETEESQTTTPSTAD